MLPTRLVCRIGLMLILCVITNLLNVGTSALTARAAPSIGTYALEVYNNPDFTGPWCYADTPQTANIAGTCTDQITSIFLKPGWSVRVFRDGGSGGPSVCLNRSLPNLADATFEDFSIADNAISSFALYNQAWCGGAPVPAYPLEVYNDPGYLGAWCYSPRPETVNVNATCTDQISAMLLRSGWAIKLYRDPNQQGPAACMTGIDANLTDNTFNDGSSLNDAISSFVLYAQPFCSNVPPNIPAPQSPANGAALNTTAITIQWTDQGDPDTWPNFARNYSGELWKSDQSWSASLPWQNGTNWTITVPSPGMYYWRVQSGDGAEGSGWSATWSFTVTNPPPSDVTVADINDPNVERGGTAAYLYSAGSGSVVANGHATWTGSSASTLNNYLRWKPALPRCGNWEVFAYIPWVSNSLADTTVARYQIRHRNATSPAGSVAIRLLNQQAINASWGSTRQDRWYSLGTYLWSQNAHSVGEYVYLGDMTGEREVRSVNFDDLRWVYRSDNVGACSTTIPTTASLTGRITSGGSGQSAAMVTLGSQTAQTNGNGEYSFSNIAPNTSYPFAVTKSGCVSHQSNVSIPPGATTKNVDLSCTASQQALSFPLSPRVNNVTGGPVNTYYDLDGSSDRVFDAAHPRNSQVTIGNRAYTAPWPTSAGWRLGIAYNGHDGTDYHGDNNQTSVIAAAPGYIVSYREVDPDSYLYNGQWYNRNLPGNNVIIRHPNIQGIDICIVYHHIKAYTVSSIVKNAKQNGTLVPRGSVLARVGNSGNSTGTHLHFGVSNCATGAKIDPYTSGLWMPGAGLQLADDTNHAHDGTSEASWMTPLLTHLYASPPQDEINTTQMMAPSAMPTAVFTTNMLVAQPQQAINFDASASLDPDGPLVQYLWDFGDGVQEHGRLITHSYEFTGTYQVTLRAIDGTGDDALSESQMITVTDRPAGSDVMPPQATVTLVNAGYINTLMTTVQVVLTSADSPNTVQARYSTNGDVYSAWEPLQATKDIQVSGSDGDYSVYVQVSDGAGNVSQPFVAMGVIDTVVPLVGLDAPIVDTNAPGEIRFGWNIVDANEFVHGIVKVEYQLVDVDTTWRLNSDNPDPGAAAIYHHLRDGTYTFLVRVTDQAGNQTVQQATTSITVPFTYTYAPFINK